ncbi:MAG: hypothetical protein WBA17_06545 [Saprospiraceae bacterium]
MVRAREAVYVSDLEVLDLSGVLAREAVYVSDLEVLDLSGESDGYA